MRQTLQKLLIFLIIVSTNTSALAVSLLKINERSPYTGYLFSEEETKKLQLDLLDLDYLKKDKVLLEGIINTQSLQIDKYKNSLELLRNQNERLLNENSDINKTRTLENSIFFILGIVLTGTIAYVSK